MTGRRDFIGLSIACGASLALPSLGQTADTPSGPARTAFEALQGQRFRLADGKGYLQLSGVRSPASSAAGVERFTVSFRAIGDTQLEKAVYQLDNRHSGPLALFLEPAGTDNGTRLYEADFALLC